MKKYFGLFGILFFSLMFVSGQTGLGVPTSYPQSPLWTASGTPPLVGDGYGYRVANAGDVDGDGNEDIIVSALVIPSPSSVSTTNRVEVINGRTGALIYSYSSPPLTSLYGGDVEGLGDVNGDGRSEFVIASGQSTAQVYNGINGNLLYTINSPVPTGLFAEAIAKTNDLSGDGFPELIIGTTNGGIPNAVGTFGTVYVYNGVNGALLRTIYAPTGSVVFGISVHSLKDITNDGVNEIIVGDPGFFGSTGSVFVYNGATGALIYNLLGSGSALSRFGASLSDGDFNADGVQDIFVGEPTGSQSNGNIFVFSGVNGLLLVQINGLNNADFLGVSVVGTDVNGDAYADIVAPSYAAPNGNLYVFSGPSGSLISTINSGNYGADIDYLDLDNDLLNEIILSDIGGQLAAIGNPGAPSFSPGSVKIVKFGGILPYGVGTLVASWLPAPGFGSQGTVSFTGFNPGEQNICIALSGSSANLQISPGVNVYVNPNDPAFLIDCSFTADFAGTVTFQGISIQNTALAGSKIYVEAAKSDLSAASNGLEITFLA